MNDLGRIIEYRDRIKAESDLATQKMRQLFEECSRSMEHFTRVDRIFLRRLEEYDRR